MGVGVGRFLARGRPARLAACAVVVFAAVVWLSVAIVVLRVVFVVALLLVAVWCAWLVAAVWWRPVEWKGPSLAAVCRCGHGCGSRSRCLPRARRLRSRVRAGATS